MTRWVYIAGRGHSGSTMLDAMLGNQDGIESVGELVSGMGRYEALCSCGAEFKDCQFWTEVRQRFQASAGVSWDEAVSSSVSQAHTKFFFKTFFAPLSAKWVQLLVRHSNGIADAICQPDNELVIDSSKEITRALFLLRFLPETRIIHLVRHPQNILQSDYYRLAKGGYFKFLRMRFKPRSWFAPYLVLSAISWTIGNFLAELARCFGRDQFLRVRYEDLIDSPAEELERIEKFINVSLCEVKRKAREKEAFHIGHNIGGNYMRMAKSFVIDPGKASRSGLPEYYGIIVNAICWPFLWAYG